MGAVPIAYDYLLQMMENDPMSMNIGYPFDGVELQNYHMSANYILSQKLIKLCEGTRYYMGPTEPIWTCLKNLTKDDIRLNAVLKKLKRIAKI